MATIRKETIEEFLARGGQIKRYPAVKPDDMEETIRVNTPPNVQTMSLDEGAHFFSEIRERKPKKAKDPLKGIDVNKLPDDIRKLFNL